jgi:phosphate transport system substrate-binding protein
VVVNQRNNWARLVTTRELARLWGRQAQGRINRWNQVNIDWPDRPLRLCAPGNDSGTHDMFNKAISGDVDNARQDVVSSEDDAVLVKCVASDPNAIGYFGYSYYASNRDKLRALTIVGTKGPVAPSPQSVQNETYLPLSRPLFLYVNDQALLSNDTGRRFLNWTLRNGLRLSEEVGLIPLPSSTYRLAETKLYRRVLGSAFGGDLAVGEGVSHTLRRSLESLKRPEFR